MKNIVTLLLLSFCFTTAIAQTEKDKVMNTVNINSIQGPIYFLADDLLKGRQTGSPENKIAAAYLANELRSFGVMPNPVNGTYYQPFSLKKTSPPKSLVLSIDGKELKHKVAIDASPTKFVADIVYLGYGLEEDYKGKDVRKKIVFIKGGSEKAKDARGAFGLRKQKADLAKEAGAYAVVELIQASENMWGFIDHNFSESRLENVTEENDGKPEAKMPYIWVQDEYGTHSTMLEDGKARSAKLSITEAPAEKVATQNVIGVVEGTDPVLKNEYIIYSAHYDHVGIGTPDETGDVIYNGARDNAVGSTTVLAMAENLAKYPTKRSALFILFTGEEKGLLGSEYYVENPVLPLNQMVYCFNSDNAGYNDTSLATIIGLPRTTAEQDIKSAAQTFGLTAIDDPAPEQGLFDRSDNVHFAKKGIPAPTFSMGFTAFNGDVTKYYHRPGDNAESLDFEYLEKFFRAYVMSGRNIGNNPVTPVWTKGDKYEAAGKKLYNK